MSDSRTSISACRRTAAAGLALVAAATLAGCGGVQIKPELDLPEALITPMPAAVVLVVPEDMRNYVHKETRWGVSWQIDLGAGHAKLARELLSAEFADVREAASVEEAKGMSGVKAIFEPRIEQYSFVTARETGGRYYAVTIRYRINLYSPTGELVDSYTLTGYGNALAKGITSGRPLQAASLAAMRDAAAKFLVQFPEQPAGKLLARNEPVVAEPASAASGDTATEIEAVPINEPKTAETPAPAPVPTPQQASSTTEVAAPGSAREPH